MLKLLKTLLEPGLLPVAMHVERSFAWWLLPELSAFEGLARGWLSNIYDV